VILNQTGQFVGVHVVGEQPRRLGRTLSALVLKRWFDGKRH